jgi:hypothetical protein
VAVAVRHRAFRWPALTLLALLALAGAEQATAQLGIIWRVAVLSWDNPLTQLHDEVACQATLSADPSRQASDHARVALVPSGRLGLTAGGDGDEATPGPAHLTRSPPVR